MAGFSEALSSTEGKDPLTCIQAYNLVSHSSLNSVFLEGRWILHDSGLKTVLRSLTLI